MLKNILKLEGVQLLNKKVQLTIRGGHECGCDDPDNGYVWETPCYDTFIGC
ncbi:hypothetical protein [Kordia jejudonensis]|uniref:hypothetical protein n=1 Tax=Kordia jejudonensis TaxID=1348245 RepID=UPI0012E08606|nr:hypothetical protein [Kordia jejudonensis]